MIDQKQNILLIIQMWYIIVGHPVIISAVLCFSAVLPNLSCATSEAVYTALGCEPFLGLVAYEPHIPH